MADGECVDAGGVGAMQLLGAPAEGAAGGDDVVDEENGLVIKLATLSKLESVPNKPHPLLTGESSLAEIAAAPFESLDYRSIQHLPQMIRNKVALVESAIHPMVEGNRDGNNNIRHGPIEFFKLHNHISSTGEGEILLITIF